MESQRALFSDQGARDQYLEEMREKAIKILGLPMSPGPARFYETVRIILPDLLLWATPDNLQTREKLASEIIRKLQELVQVKSITRLHSLGIELIVPPRQGLQYVLFASICY